MKIFNQTDLKPGWIVGKLPPYAVSASFVLKGTYTLIPSGPAVPAEKPDELEGDVPEPGTEAAIRYCADLVPFKPNIDILLTGSGTRRTSVRPLPFPSRCRWEAGRRRWPQWGNARARAVCWEARDGFSRSSPCPCCGSGATAGLISRGIRRAAGERR